MNWVVSKYWYYNERYQSNFIIRHRKSDKENSKKAHLYLYHVIWTILLYFSIKQQHRITTVPVEGKYTNTISFN